MSLHDARLIVDCWNGSRIDGSTILTRRAKVQLKDPSCRKLNADLVRSSVRTRSMTGRALLPRPPCGTLTDRELIKELVLAGEVG